MSWTRFFRRKHWDQERARELEAYLELETEENLARGMSPKEARHAAHRKLGNTTQIREEIYHMNSLGWVEILWQDLRHSLRQIKANPGFTLAVVITLALGIGANSAVFSVLNGLFLRTLPVPYPERLVTFSDDSHSWSDYLAYRDQAKSFESLSTSFGLQFTANLNSSHPPRHVYGSTVTGNFLTTLGVKPALGRGFLPDEDQLGSPKPLVILSYKLWRSELGADPAIVGRTIRLNNAAYTVVGVMPSDLRTVDFGMAPDLWAPMATWQDWKPVQKGQASPFEDPTSTSFGIFGRLRAGVSRQTALAEVNVINDRLRRAAGDKEWHPVALTPAGELPGGLGEIFLGVSAVVSIIAGLVLLIACVNIANLLLARGTSRRREIAIRLAIGASRGRVVRQLMTGNLILSLLGAAAALPLAWTAAKAVERVQLPFPGPVTFDFAPDLRVVGVTAGLALLTSLLFGLAPAARATRQDVSSSLKDGDAASTGSVTRWTRNALVMVQVAVSVVVLVSAALFLHSVWNGFSTNMGFRPENLLVVRFDPAAQGYSRERTALFLEQVEQQVAKLPAVRWASVVVPLPLSMAGSGRDFSVPRTSRRLNAQLRLVGRHYFETMGIPVLKGRDFHDVAASSPPVAAISRLMADRLFPNENPVGQRIASQNLENEQTFEIVGVVGDAKAKTIGETLRPCLYELAPQNVAELDGFRFFGAVALVIKTAGNPKALTPLVQQQVERLDPGLPIYGVESMEEQIGKSLVLARLASWFLGVFGLLALILAAVGLYGLMNYSVAARTREIAIRMAMGATRGETLSMLLREGLGVVGVGLVVGLASGLGVGRLVSNLLYGIGSFDPFTFIVVPLALALVACVAILLPARRATRIDPLVALRYE